MSKLTNEQTWELIEILQEFQEPNHFDYAWEMLKTFITEHGFASMELLLRVNEEEGEN